MGRKADRIEALEAEVIAAERERDVFRGRCLALQRQLDEAGCRPSLTDRVRDEIGDRVGWLRDAMGLGL